MTQNLGFAYPARFEATEDGTLLVRFRDLPEAMTEGADEADALREAEDCLEEALAHRMLQRLVIPLPSRRAAGEILVAPGLQIAAKLALTLAQKAAGLNNVALAKRLGCDEKEVRRLLDPHHKSRLDRLDAAVKATEGTLELRFRPPPEPRKRVAVR